MFYIADITTSIMEDSKMKKENKRYHIIAKLHKYTDYYPEDEVVRTEQYYRMGVSESQVVARLKRTEGLKDYDSPLGNEAYRWTFLIEDVTTTLIDEFDALRKDSKD